MEAHVPRVCISVSMEFHTRILRNSELQAYILWNAVCTRSTISQAFLQPKLDLCTLQLLRPVYSARLIDDLGDIRPQVDGLRERLLHVRHLRRACQMVLKC